MSFHKLSRRIFVEAVSVLPDINIDVPNQLTLFAFAVTVRVMVEPGAAVLSNVGVNVTVPVTPELVSSDITLD